MLWQSTIDYYEPNHEKTIFHKDIMFISILMIKCLSFLDFFKNIQSSCIYMNIYV